ncbi:MAG TPA: hypothetical protein VG247_32485 [Pseudonocardiaceae bacterium]|jgi:hypothetical protein|nr:hypothetical protein [Pseudonocardiaceae bacterium]
MRTVRWLSAAAWIFSWRIVYLEIFRWHHMSRTLRFTGPPGAKPGIPVRAIRVCAVASPVVFLSTFFRS